MFIQFEGSIYNVNLMRHVKLITINAIPNVEGKERTYFIVRADYGTSHTDIMQTFDKNMAEGLIREIRDRGNNE